MDMNKYEAFTHQGYTVDICTQMYAQGVCLKRNRELLYLLSTLVKVSQCTIYQNGMSVEY